MMTDTRRDIRPLLKWAGGKRRLLAQYAAYFPTATPVGARYIEPFVGGGAVFFYLAREGRLPAAVFLSDYNAELINAYTVVRDELPALLPLLAEHKACHSQEYYYQIRVLDRQALTLSPVERAARLLYLNKTCFNGLYRVNRKGQFNVPFGRYKNPTIYDPVHLTAVSAVLQNVQLDARDFRSLANWAQPGDFIYFDPPYDPVSKTASFTSYTAGSFGDDDQRDLADLFAQLTRRGCRCMLSNSHTPFILDLYQDFYSVTVQAGRAINAKATGRGLVNEVLVWNYGEKGTAISGQPSAISY